MQGESTLACIPGVGVLVIMHGNSILRIPIVLGLCTSGFQQSSSFCVHQARSAVKCSGRDWVRWQRLRVQSSCEPVAS